MCELYETPDGELVEVRKEREGREREKGGRGEVGGGSDAATPDHPFSNPPLLSQVMCGDYGFRSGFGRLYQGGDAQKPASGLALVSGRD